MSRINPTLRLVCHICGLRPPEAEIIGIFQQHFAEFHPDDGIKLDLSAFCTCGKEMRFTFTQGPLGSIYRDNYKCDNCGNEGFITRDKEK